MSQRWMAMAAALLLTTTAIAQQAQPTAANAQPPVGFGAGLEADPQGPKVSNVAPDGTAAALGLRPGDILVQVGERPVSGPQIFSEYVQSLKVGDPVSVTVKRDGRSIELKGKALARPASWPAPPPNRSTPVEAGELRETLYQMLVSLNEGLDATVTALAAAHDGGTVEIQPEPFDGGDVQVGSASRLVIQIKRRAANRRWSVGDIIRDVLPDLVEAVRVGAGDRFQFVTDNDTGCDDFRRFLAWHARRASGEGGVPEERFRYGAGTTVSGEELLAAIPGVLKIEARDPRLPMLLSSLEILRRDEVDLLREIDVPLGVLVERIEDVPHKRELPPSEWSID